MKPHGSHPPALQQAVPRLLASSVSVRALQLVSSLSVLAKATSQHSVAPDDV
jgi:hypothetical protein